MGFYSMPLYYVPLFIALVGSYYMYRIHTTLALSTKLNLRFPEPACFGNALVNRKSAVHR